MNEPIEVTLHVGMDGSMLPRSFVWTKKTFRINEIGRRWETEDGEHFMVMVDPMNNAYELFKQTDGTWFLIQGHNRPTVTMI